MHLALDLEITDKSRVWLPDYEWDIAIVIVVGHMGCHCPAGDSVMIGGLTLCKQDGLCKTVAYGRQCDVTDHGRGPRNLTDCGEDRGGPAMAADITLWHWRK